MCIVEEVNLDVTAFGIQGCVHEFNEEVLLALPLEGSAADTCQLELC
jgi:hypothetical protein